MFLKDKIDKRKSNMDTLIGVIIHNFGNVIKVVLAFFAVGLYAKFLTPFELGIAAIGQITIAAGESFTYTGFEESLIKNNNNNNKEVNTLWTINVFRGIFIYVIIFFSAPFLGTYFNTDQIAIVVIRVMSLAIPLKSLTNLNIVTIRKELNYKKQFIYEYLPIIIGNILGLLYIIVYKNFWGIVIMHVAIVFTKTFLSFFINKNYSTVNLSFDLNIIKNTVKFSGWIYLSSILFFINSRADNLIVAKLAGVEMLGLYAFSYNFVDKFIIQTGKMFNNVLFPKISLIKEDCKECKSFFFKALKLHIVLIGLLCSGIMVLYPAFVRIFLNEHWRGTIPIVSLLSISSSLIAIGLSAHFYAFDKSFIEFKLRLIRTIIFLLLIIVTLSFSTVIVIVSIVLVANLVTTVIWFIETKRLFEYKMKEYSFVANIIFFISVLVYLGARYQQHIDTKFEFFLACLVVTLIYLSSVTLMNLGVIKKFFFKNLTRQRLNS
jgi:O-antigen/teichoic acid export membrane protein